MKINSHKFEIAFYCLEKAVESTTKEVKRTEERITASKTEGYNFAAIMVYEEQLYQQEQKLDRLSYIYDLFKKAIEEV